MTQSFIRPDLLLVLVRLQIFLGTCQRPLKFTEDDVYVILSGTLLSDIVRYMFVVVVDQTLRYILFYCGCGTVGS